MVSFHNINKLFRKYIDEPHEKIMINIVNIVLFSFIYYGVYLKNKNSFMINELMLISREENELNYYDFFILFNIIEFYDFIWRYGTIEYRSKSNKFNTDIYILVYCTILETNV